MIRSTTIKTAIIISTETNRGGTVTAASEIALAIEIKSQIILILNNYYVTCFLLSIVEVSIDAVILASWFSDSWSVMQFSELMYTV